MTDDPGLTTQQKARLFAVWLKEDMRANGLTYRLVTPEEIRRHFEGRSTKITKGWCDAFTSAARVQRLMVFPLPVARENTTFRVYLINSEAGHLVHTLLHPTNDAEFDEYAEKLAAPSLGEVFSEIRKLVLGPEVEKIRGLFRTKGWLVSSPPPPPDAAKTAPTRRRGCHSSKTTKAGGDTVTGARLREWRLEQGHRQEDLGNLLGGVKQYLISQYECGDRLPSLDHAEAIRNLTDIAPTDWQADQ